MIDEQLQFKIQAYLDGSLKGQELEQFQAQLATDKELATEVALFQEMDNLLGEVDVIDFENTIGSVLATGRLEESKDTKKKTPFKDDFVEAPTTPTEKPPQKTSTSTATIRQMQPKPNAFRRILAIAAGVALIAVVGTVLFLNTNEVIAPESLYASNMDFPSELAGGSGLRSSEESIDTIAAQTQQLINAWATANKAYKDQQYESALTAINAIEQIDTNFESEIEGNLLFKKGLVLLKLKQPKAAITAFEKVKDGDYVLTAQWKRALTLLIVDTEQAKIALQKIADDTRHTEQKKAVDLLEKL